MPRDNSGRTVLNRRQFIGATGIGLLASSVGSSAVADGDGGDGGGGGNGNGGGVGGGTGPETHTVTLITGHTVHVTRNGDERVYSVDGDAGTFDVFEREEGTFVLPADADTTVYSEHFFNVDFLIEQGFTDERTDTIPVLVKPDGRTRRASDVDALGGMGALENVRTLESIGSVAAEVPKDASAATAQTMSRSEGVERVSLDVKYQAMLDTSAEAIEAPAARDAVGVDGSGVSIAVVDTGIDADHPDLGDRVVHEADFSGDGTDDVNGHGTHVAGIAAGDGTESDGEYVGVAPGADLWNVKVLGDGGSGSLSDIVAGIEHAVEEGVDVINMSLGGPVQEDDPMATAVDYAASEGVVTIVASGNDYGYRSITSPGQATGAITVGATDHEAGTIPSFSSGGPTPLDYRVKPEIVAPGVEIDAAGSEDAGESPYTSKSGTSMAAPHVAGLAALLLEQDGDRTPEAVRDRLVSTATPLEGADIFLQGGGQVDATAALDADLRVIDSVTSFGLYDEEATDATELTVENTGGDPLAVEVEASLHNVQSGDDLADNVSVDTDSLTIDPGAQETIELELAVDDTFGYGSGVITLETDDETYRAVFGYLRGMELTIEKRAHPAGEQSDVAGDDLLQSFTPDGEFRHGQIAAFDEDGIYRTVVFDDLDDEVTFWTSGEHPETGEWILCTETAHVDRDHTHVVIDEGDAVRRTLETDDLEHDSLRVHELEASLYASFEEFDTAYNRGSYGADETTVWFTELEDGSPINVSTGYILLPEATHADHDPEFRTLDNDYVYHLFYPSTTVEGPEDVVTPDPDALATERMTYRKPADRIIGITPHTYPADQDRFPDLISFGFLRDVGGTDRYEHTFYRTEHAAYAEGWRDDSSFFGEWDAQRLAVTPEYGFIPDAGERYESTFNAEPLAGGLSAWDLADGDLFAAGAWYIDQSPGERFVFYDLGTENEYALALDGEVVEEGGSWDNAGASFVFDYDAIDPGTAVDLSLHGSALTETARETETATDYHVTYEPDTANAPPQLETVTVTGANAFNEVPAGAVVVLVETTEPLAEFEALYAGTGTVEATPFDDADGWTAAEVRHADDTQFAVVVDATGYDGLDLAFAGVDADGNAVETTTFGAVDVTDGAVRTAPIDVRANQINLGSRQSVPVVIEPADDLDPHEIDVDTLRFGEPAAVADGEGAPAHRAQKLGNGALQVQFRANETGYEESRSPAAAQLVGELEDGTAVSGADLVETVTTN